MFFLMRSAFWLTLVLALVSFGTGGQQTETKPINPVATLFAAQAAVSDLGGFCGRNPQACEAGGEALSVIGERARDGARIVYEFIGTKMAETDHTNTPVTADETPIVTGSTTPYGTQIHQDNAPVLQMNTSALRPDTPLGPVPRPNPRAG